MIVGAYWSQRKESRDQAATRIATFLVNVASRHQTLSTWFFKGKTKAAARSRELDLSVASVARALTVNRRDVDRQSMPEVGFRLGIWNGDEVSFSVTIGSYSPYVGNHVVLTFADEHDWLDEPDRRDLLNAEISAFDPDHAVVTNRQILAKAGATDPWDAGWLTYARCSGVQEHTVS